MAITEIHVCDFIWTPNEFTVETIFNEKFLERKMLSNLKNFYFDFVLTDIIYPKYPEDPCDYSLLLIFNFRAHQ